MLGLRVCWQMSASAASEYNAPFIFQLGPCDD